MNKGQRKRTPNVRTQSRQQQIREEVYSILHEEAFKRYKSINEREDNVSKRLSTLEQTGLPDQALGEIKTAISQIRYMQNQQQRAMQGLLNFFNITKDFFKD